MLEDYYRVTKKMKSGGERRFVYYRTWLVPVVQKQEEGSGDSTVVPISSRKLLRDTTILLGHLHRRRRL